MEVRAAALASVLLFLALQLQRISSYAAVLDFKACGEDELSFSGSFSYELLYINGIPVGKSLFCDAVNFHSANGCLLEDYHQFCSLPQVEVHSLGERKLLLTGPKEDSTKDKEGNKTLLSNKTIGIVIPGILALCCVLICPCFYAKRKDASHTVLQKEISSSNSASELNFTPEKIPGSPLRVPPSPSRFSLSPQLTRFGSVHLNLSQILKATHNFSLNMRIGEGGFGTVYKAQLENGLVVAVKRAKKELFDNLKTEFSSEVELLSKIDHRNLVKLLGFVDQGNERLIITEYVPNGTLRTHLDGDHGKILDFNQRLEIAIDVAHGLTYLHLYAEKQIIHRDVKSSNILLTDSMRAKVADFGFARLGSMDSDKTHVSTKVKGTVGYLDPEYMRTYQLTPKSDVYSFGILLLEILTGRRPVELNRAVEERVTLRWVFTKFNEGNVSVLVDPRMEEVVDAGILSRIISLAIECAAPRRANRPDMKLVGEALWAIRVDYLKTVKRGY